MRNNIDIIFYICIGLILAILYYLLSQSGQTIYLIFFIIVWLGFTTYGFYIIIKTFFKNKK